MAKSRMTPESFIEAWQNSATIEDAAKKLGSTVNNLRSKAYQYRAAGVTNLKKFPRRGHTLDVKALNKLAGETAPKKAKRAKAKA